MSNRSLVQAVLSGNVSLATAYRRLRRSGEKEAFNKELTKEARERRIGMPPDALDTHEGEFAGGAGTDDDDDLWRLWRDVGGEGG